MHERVSKDELGSLVEPFSQYKMRVQSVAGLPLAFVGDTNCFPTHVCLQRRRFPGRNQIPMGRHNLTRCLGSVTVQGTKSSAPPRLLDFLFELAIALCKCVTQAFQPDTHVAEVGCALQDWGELRIVATCGDE